VARNRRVARLVPPPREPPAPEPTPKRSASVVRITESALATATAHRTKPYQIELPQFPPGVLPNDGHQMAADEALTDTLSWANTQFYSGVVEEGMTFLGYPVLAVMLQRPEYRVMAEEISSEMVREWIELKATGEDDRSEKIKEIGDEMRRLHVREVFGQAAFIDAAMGRAHIYLDTGDGDDRDELKTTVGDGSSVGSGAKINPEKRLIGIRTVEPIWSYPLHYNSIDPLSPDFYAPKIWAVMGKEIHHTRFLTLVGRPVPDILKPAYAFGGLSLTQMAKPYVENWLRTRQAVSDLIYNFSVMVLSTDGERRVDRQQPAAVLQPDPQQPRRHGGQQGHRGPQERCRPDRRPGRLAGPVARAFGIGEPDPDRQAARHSAGRIERHLRG
jgi:hypothetical protein